jgi:hypothetical protein
MVDGVTDITNRARDGASLSAMTLRRTPLPCTEQAIARVAKSGEDVAVGVQLAVE